MLVYLEDCCNFFVEILLVSKLPADEEFIVVMVTGDMSSRELVPLTETSIIKPNFLSSRIFS
jgi:hypothetical protein